MIRAATGDTHFKPTVMLDPGHGGADIGVTGRHGAMEKDIVLNLARIIKAELGTSIQVLLTRENDFKIDLATRAAIANHACATLFVSLHMGGSANGTQNSVGLFYQSAAPPVSGDDNTPPWQALQQPHIAASRQMAKTIAVALPVPVLLQEAGLPILAGLDMPAVLIEAGYLTNPELEAFLTRQNGLTIYGEAIAIGIRTFLEQP